MSSSPELNLPGFRFHPTEEELLNFYLRNAILGKSSHYSIIGVTNIYHHDPWDLPRLAKIGEREWYFFVPRDRKQGSSGGRPNRTTENGFWKATGSDRRIVSLSEPKRIIGLRKTLVFYRGRAPRGRKTDWVMNEYRFPDSTSLPQDMVLCKIYRKATSLKVLEQRAATMEEGMRTTPAYPSSPMDVVDAPITCSGREEDFVIMPTPVSPHHHQMVFKEEEGNQEVVVDEERNEAGESYVRRTSSAPPSSIQLPAGTLKLPELQMPINNKSGMDWTQEPFWNPLGSPWFLNLTPIASILNF